MNYYIGTLLSGATFLTLKRLQLSASMFRNPLICLIWLVSSLPALSIAAEEPIVVDVISRLSENSNLSSSIRIEREEILRMNPSSVTQLLRVLPGVTLFESSGNERLSYVSIKGGESNFTLVLLDGIRVNDPTNSRGGGFDFSQLDIAIIDSVEVFTGDVSAIYGGAAMNGVISITTMANGSSSLTLEGGTQSEYRANIVQSFSSGSHSGLLSLSTSDGGDAYLGSIDNWQGLGKYQFDGSAISVASLISYSKTDSEAFPEDSGATELAVLRDLETVSSDLLLAGVTINAALSDGVTWQNAVSWQEHKESVKSPGIPSGERDGIPASDIDSQYQNLLLDSYLNIMFESAEAIFGFSYEDATGNNEGFLDFGFPLETSFELDQSVTSLFAEYSTSFGQLDIDIGGRYDEPEKFDSQTSIRFHSSYDLNENWLAEFSWSEGYKLPSFFALAHPLVGNANLEPEESLSRSFAVNYASESGHTDLTVEYFSNNYLNLVDFDPERFISINRGEVDAKGFNLSANFTIKENLEFSVSSDYLDIDIRSSADSLRRRPQLDTSFALNYSWQNGLSAFVNYHQVSDFFESSIPTGSLTLPSFSRLDVVLSKTFANKVLLKLALDNVTDNDFQHSIGFRDFGFRARLGLSMQI